MTAKCVKPSHKQWTEKRGQRIEVVLASLAETIKEIERHKYVQSVFGWHLHGADWNLRCAIARLSQEEYRLCIPDRLAGCPPEQLADLVPALVFQFICTDSVLEQISFSGEKSPISETSLL